MNKNASNTVNKPGSLLAIGGLCALCGILVFHFFGNSVRGYIDTASMFTWWISQWFNDRSETEHGPIILALSVWIFWRNLNAAPADNNKARPVLGFLLILGGLGIHLVGYLVQQTRISIVGFLVFTVGACYLAGGNRWGRASIFPALFMFFSMPLEFLTDEIGFQLRLGVIKVSHGLAGLLGFDVVRTGTQLYSPDGTYQYDVAPACSGIRSLVALTALSLLIGYLSFKSFWRRTLLLILALPYAFLGNILRIFFIILAAEWAGQKAGAFVHEWFGFIVFIIVLGLALLTVTLLEKLVPEKKPLKSTSQDKSMDTKQFHAPVGLTWSLAAVVVVASLLVSLLTRRADSMKVADQCGVYLAPNNNDPVSLPRLLDYEWLGKEQPVSQVERDILPLDTGFSRKIYTNVGGQTPEVLLSIVLSGKDRSSIHKPEVCLVGQGWTIRSKTVHEFEIPEFAEGKLKTTLLRMEYTGQAEDGKQQIIPALFAYWFVSGDTMVASHRERMIKSAKDRLFGLKAHRWAYVFAQTIILDGEEAGLERMQEVISLAVPEFQRVGFEDE